MAEKYDKTHSEDGPARGQYITNNTRKAQRKLDNSKAEYRKTLNNIIEKYGDMVVSDLKINEYHRKLVDKIIRDEIVNDILKD